MPKDLLLYNRPVIVGSSSMKKRTTNTPVDVILLLVLLVALTPQLICIKVAKADTEATSVICSTGGMSWFDANGWTNEDSVSANVYTYVKNLFDSPPYDDTYYPYGGAVTAGGVLDTIEDHNEYDYATVFLFANGVNYTDQDIIYYLGYPLYYYDVTHYSFYDSYYSGDNNVTDVEIGAITHYGSSFQFVFLWSCAQGSEIGCYHDSYWIDAYLYRAGTGAAGMPYAWTNRDYTQMSSDGLDDPDAGDYCFIGFEGFGIPLSEVIPDSGGKDYGDFVKAFYSYVLDDGYLVNDALDASSNDVMDENFNQTTIYTGYTYELTFGEETMNWSGRIHVYGNGNNYLPN